MIDRTALSLVVLAFIVSPAFGQVPTTSERLVFDQFDGLDTKLWCPCQMKLDGDSKLHFPKERGNSIARIPILESNIGGNTCDTSSECAPLLEKPFSSFAVRSIAGAPPLEDPEPPERLGPSLIFDPPGLSLPKLDGLSAAAPFLALKGAEADYPDGGPYCTEARRAEGLSKKEDVTTPCTQRQELRFHNKKMHEYGETLLYAFRFRMERPVPDETKSIRWVTAQWKQEPATQPKDQPTDPRWEPSPFLSQRFDDGVLHVAVQDEDCRCLVAAARGLRKRSWPARPEKCRSTAIGPNEGKTCEANLTAVYDSTNPFLPTARGRWVTLRYLVKPGRDGSGIVQIFDDKRLVVTVTGSIGYEPSKSKPSLIKFKIGQYNDFMPGLHLMDVDWLTVDRVEAQGTAGQSARP